MRPTSICEQSRPRKLRLLVAANGPKDVACAQAIVVRLSKVQDITTRAIVDEVTHRLTQEVMVLPNRSIKRSQPEDDATGRDIEDCQKEAYEIVEWADLLVLAPIDADNLAKMMVGVADTLLLQVLRSWNTSKRILLVPGMTTHMWEHPVTKKQLSKLSRKWNWVRVMSPILWHYESSESTDSSGTQKQSTKRTVTWDGFNEVVNVVRNQADLLLLGHDVEVAVQRAATPVHNLKTPPVLPPEVLSIIFDYANDWELAKHLGVFTTLPMPTWQGWRLQPKDNDPVNVFNHELEWTILHGDAAKICAKLSEASPDFQDMSALAIHLLFKFNFRDVLSYIETNRPRLLKSFDGRTIPTKASAYYARTDILDWWARSPSFLEKHYDAEALDGASAKGFLSMLEWWRRSGLPLKYSERAFEQASSKGHLQVLEWWRALALQDKDIVLKPGRSLVGAAQHGHVAIIRWWEDTAKDTGITIGFQDQVCKMASRWGHVNVLELWRELRGDDKILFNSMILSEPTFHGHVEVLDWWSKYAKGKLPGMAGVAKRVEFKIMDIEEALEDSLGDQKRVRRWWAEQGLNLGVGTSEWMAMKCL